MIWFTLAMFVVSFALSYLLTPRPSVESARPQKFGGLTFPRASTGDPMPYILGRVRLESPSVLWYGNFTSQAISEDGRDIAYNYFLGFHLGLCTGPGVVLRAIWVEDRQVFTSGVGVTGGTVFTIDKPSFFGGPKKGGGIVGEVAFYSGENSQPQDSWLAQEIFLGPLVPSYPGFSSLVFRGIGIGTSPSLRRMSVTVERYPNNLGLPGNTNVVGDDLNLMEALYSGLTEGWGGLNADPADIDTQSLIDAGAVLFAEGNGISFKVENSNQGKDFITEILRQADGIMYQDPITGKIVVKLIREDYTVGSLPVFDKTNVESITNWTRTDWSEAPNQVRVTFTDPLRVYKQSTAMVQDQASIASRTKVKSTTISFPGCTVGLTAVKLAHREMAQLSVPLFSAQLHLNRQASALRPGTPFVLNWPDFGISNSVFRIQRYDLGELVDERVVAEVMQDKFAVSTQLYAEPGSTLWSPVDRAAADITVSNVFEAPYMFVQKKVKSIKEAWWSREPILDPVDFPNSSWIWCGATKPANQERYDVIISEDNFVLDQQIALNQRSYNWQALLDVTLRKEVDSEDGTITVITVTMNVLDARLTDSDATGVRAGDNWMVIDNEIMAYQTFTNNGDGTFDLEIVRRALLDSKLEDHLAGTTVYFFKATEPYTNRVPRGDTAVIKVKLLSYTDIDAQDLDDVSAIDITYAQRYELPAPPDMTTVETARWPLEIIGKTSLAVAWRERSRLEDPIAFYDDGTDTPEASTTYDARLFIDGVEIEEQTGIATTTATFNTAVDGWGDARVEVEAVQGGQTSWTTDDNHFFHASYPSLGSELVVNGRIESSLGAEWSTTSGTWAKTVTDNPLQQAYDENNTGDNDHLQATGTTNEIRQTITIGGESGNNAIFRCWRNSTVAGETSQIVLELLDGGASVLDSVTTALVAADTLYKWERIEINLPLRTDAISIRIRVISPGTSYFDMFSIKANANSIDSDVFYDDLTSITSVKGAWGFRKMLSTSSGAIIRIADSYDSVEQDVGMDIDGNLAPFHVRGTPKLLTLYDQTGNGNDLISFKVGDPRTIPMMSQTGRCGGDWYDTAPAIGFRDTKAVSTSHPYMIARPNTFLVCGKKRNTAVSYMFNIPDGVPQADNIWNWAMLASSAWDVRLNGVQEATGTWDGAPASTDANVIFIDASSGNAYHNDPTVIQDTWTAADVDYDNATRLYISGRDAGSLNTWNPDAFHEFCIIDGAPDATDRATMMNFLKDYWFNT